MQRPTGVAPLRTVGQSHASAAFAAFAASAAFAAFAKGYGSQVMCRTGRSSRATFDWEELDDPRLRPDRWTTLDLQDLLATVGDPLV